MSESDGDSDDLDMDSYSKGAEGTIDRIMAVYKKSDGCHLALVTWDGCNDKGAPWEPSWQEWNDLPHFDKKAANRILMTKFGGDIYTESNPPPLQFKALAGYPEYLQFRQEWRDLKKKPAEEPATKRIRPLQQQHKKEDSFVDDDDGDDGDDVVLFDESEMENAAKVVEKEHFQADFNDQLDINHDNVLSLVPRLAVDREEQALTMYSNAVAVNLNDQKVLKEKIWEKIVLDLNNTGDKFDKSLISVDIKSNCVKGLCLVCNASVTVLKQEITLEQMESVIFDLKTLRKHIRSNKCFDRLTGEAKLSSIVQQQAGSRLLDNNRPLMDIREAKAIVAKSFGPWLYKSNPRRFRSPAYRAAFLSLGVKILELIFENSTMVRCLETQSFAPGLKRLMLVPSNPLPEWIKCLSQFISKLNSLSRFRRFTMGPLETMVTSSTSSSYRIMAYEFLVYLCINEKEVVPDIELLLSQWQQSNRVASGSQKRHEGFLRAVVAQQQRLENLNLFASLWDQMILYSDYAATLLRLSVLNGANFVSKMICENPDLEYCLQVAAVLGIFVSVQGSRKQIFSNLVFIMEADLVDTDAPLIQTALLEKLGNQFVSGIVFKGEMCHVLICDDKVGKLSQPSGVRLLYWASFSLKLLQLLTLYRHQYCQVKIKHANRIAMYLENHLAPVFVRKNYRKELEMLQVSEGKEILKMMEYGLEYSPPVFSNGIWIPSFSVENNGSNSSFMALETFRKLRRVTVEVSSVLFDGDLGLLQDHALLTRHSFETVNVHYHSLLRFDTTVQAGMRVSRGCFGTTADHYPETLISDQQRLLQERLVRQKPPPSSVNILALRILCADGSIGADLKTVKESCLNQLQKIVGGFSSSYQYSVSFPSAFGSLSSAFIVLDSNFAGMLKCSCCAQPLFRHVAKIERQDQTFRITVDDSSAQFQCPTARASAFLNNFDEIDLICCLNFEKHQELLPAAKECSCAQNWSFVTAQKINGTFRSVNQFKEQILLI